MSDFSSPSVSQQQAPAHTSPASAPAEVRSEAIEGTGPRPAAPSKRNTTLLVLGIIGIAIGALILLVVVVYVMAGLGPVAFGISGILALIPLAIVLIGVNWVDRWEPEPRGILVFAFLWGAGASVLAALIVGVVIEIVAGGSDLEVFGAVVQAPVVEEFAKGFGILLILWFARKHFDGPIDGLVYGAWVAGGFAFTENILYFGSALLESGATGVAQLFFIRGLMSPFAHVMFTAFTGVALGLAARRTGAAGAIGYFLIGLIPAIGLHALWNGALFVVGEHFFVYYALVQFPLFVGAVLLVLYLRRQEAKLTRDRLAEYAAVGWFDPAEVDALATGAGRRQSMAWARQRRLGKLMRQYTHDATKLAFTRQRLITGRAGVGAVADEAALLASIVAARHALHAAAQPVAR